MDGKMPAGSMPLECDRCGRTISYVSFTLEFRGDRALVSPTNGRTALRSLRHHLLEAHGVVHLPRHG
jgi:hypothetical protein